jgi:hypothetical protein
VMVSGLNLIQIASGDLNMVRVIMGGIYNERTRKNNRV